jgi:hypothetical protein
MRLWNGKYLIVRRDGTVPAWGGLAFVVGPRDIGAAAALRAYVTAHLEAAKKSKAEPDNDYLQSVLDRADEFERYLAQEGAGDPQAAPWRFEAHDVMTALEGNTSVVVVMPDKDNSRTKPPKG